MIAISQTAKDFIVALCGQYLDQPGKSKSHDLTQREAVDAVIAFAEANRNGWQTVVDPETGEFTEIPVDLLDLEVRRTLALRAATVRANSATSKLEAKEKEVAELKAQLQALLAKANANG